MKLNELIERLKEIRDCVNGISTSSIEDMIDELIEDLKNKKLI